MVTGDDSADSAPSVAVAANRPPGFAGDGGPAFVPSTDAAEKKGVNFSRRIAAERASVFLCTEHSLLSDGWRGSLDRAEQAGLTTAALGSALRQLRQQLSASKGRGGQKRRGTLLTQIKRLEAWLTERMTHRGDLTAEVVPNETAAAATAAAPGLQKGKATRDVDVRTSGEPAEWSAFFPLLNLWTDATFP